MTRLFLGLALTAMVAAPAIAGGDTVADRHLAAYGQCLYAAAVQASYTAARSDEIYSIARSSCTDARARAARGAGKARAASWDSSTAAQLPSLIDTLRDRRRTSDATFGTPQHSTAHRTL